MSPRPKPRTTPCKRVTFSCDMGCSPSLFLFSSPLNQGLAGIVLRDLRLPGKGLVLHTGGRFTHVHLLSSFPGCDS